MTRNNTACIDIELICFKTCASIKLIPGGAGVKAAPMLVLQPGYTALYLLMPKARSMTKVWGSR